MSTQFSISPLNARGSLDPGCGGIPPDGRRRRARAPRGDHGSRRRQCPASGMPRPPRFLQVSTDEVMARSRWEGRAPKPMSWLRQAHIAPPRSARLAPVQSYPATDGLETLITRGSNTYGPSPVPGKGRPAIHHQRPPGIWPCHSMATGCSDATGSTWTTTPTPSALSLHRGEPGQINNIPGTGERANVDLTREILTQLDRPWSLVPTVSRAPAAIRRYAMDGSRLAAIGWKHRVAFEPGLSDTVAWYRVNEDWWRPLLNADWAAYYDRQYGKRLAESVPGGGAGTGGDHRCEWPAGPCAGRHCPRRRRGPAMEQTRIRPRQGLFSGCPAGTRRPRDSDSLRGLDRRGRVRSRSGAGSSPEQRGRG